MISDLSLKESNRNIVEHLVRLNGRTQKNEDAIARIVEQELVNLKLLIVKNDETINKDGEQNLWRWCCVGAVLLWALSNAGPVLNVWLR